MLEYILVGAGPLIVMGVILYSYATNNFEEVKENWVKYRCHPAYMPFASTVNPDISSAENFAYCTNLFAKSVFDNATSPIYQLFDMFQGMTGNILNDINHFLTYLAGMDKFIFEIANMVFGRLLNTFSVLSIQMGHIRDLMNRIASTAYYGVFIMSTMVSFMFSAFGVIMTTLKVVVGIIFAIAIILAFIFPILLAFFIPIGAMIGISFCFHPDTIVGGKAIKDVSIGDTLPGGKVTSLFYFECPPSLDLYVHNGVIVSGRHLVFYNGSWTYVKDTGASRYLGERPPYLVCLNTNTNRVNIGGSVFADYEEVSHPGALAEIEHLVWGKLVKQSYSVGLHPQTKVRLANGTTTTVSELKLGSVLAEGRVTGIVLLKGYDIEWFDVDGSVVSGCQPIKICDKPIFARDVGFPSSKATPPFAIQLFLDNADGWFTINNSLRVRDYPDSHNSQTLEDIQEVVMRYLNKK